MYMSLRIPILLLAASATTMVAGCAENRAERRAATRGALIGAAGGAALSAIAGGDALQGAAIGAAGGAVVGAITHDGRRRDVYRDERGQRYWIDDRGRHRRVR
jgi:osmotically inducible lipoprotein OsmB